MHGNDPQKRASGPRREAAGPRQGRSRVPVRRRPLDRQAGRLDVVARREYRDEQCNARRERIAQLRADIDKLSAELTALEQES